MDRFAAGYSILFAVLFESIAVSWIYGTYESPNFLTYPSIHHNFYHRCSPLFARHQTDGWLRNLSMVEILLDLHGSLFYYGMAHSLFEFGNIAQSLSLSRM